MTKGEFDYALIWVQRHYPELWLDGKHFTIELLPAKAYEKNTGGLCYSPVNGISRITIRRRTIHLSHIISTIVHELTHARQNFEHSTKSETEREDEAYKAGDNARFKYMEGTKCNQLK